MSDNNQNFTLSSLSEIETLDTLDLSAGTLLNILSKVTNRRKNLSTFLDTTEATREERTSVITSFTSALETEKRKVEAVLSQTASPSENATKSAKLILLAIEKQTEWANKEKPKHEPFPQIFSEPEIDQNLQTVREAKDSTGLMMYPPRPVASQVKEQPAAPKESTEIAAQNRRTDLMMRRSVALALTLLNDGNPDRLQKHFKDVFTSPLDQLKGAIRERRSAGNDDARTIEMVKTLRKLNEFCNMAREKIEQAEAEKRARQEKEKQSAVIEVVVINNPLRAIAHWFEKAVNAVFKRSASADFQDAAKQPIRRNLPSLSDAPQTVQPS